MSKLGTTDAILVGTHLVRVVYDDGSAKDFPGFQSEDEAMTWALANRGALGLARSASWYILATCPTCNLAIPPQCERFDCPNKLRH